LLNSPIIYHGVFGEGLFQSIYPTPQSEVAAYVSSIEWVVLTLFMAVLGVPLEKLRMVPLFMLGATFLVALSYMIHARIEEDFDTVRARLLVGFLAFTQPLARGWARYFTWMKYKQTPPEVISQKEEGVTKASKRGGISRLNFWNESGQGKERLLSEVFALLEREGWRYSADTGWKTWDLQIYGNRFWTVRLSTVTEYHGGPKCLTRVRLEFGPVITTVLINAIAASVVLYRKVFLDLNEPVLWSLYGMLLMWLLARGWRLKRRVAELVIAAGNRCEMVRVSGKASRPVPN
jgi:hypothetical protein